MFKNYEHFELHFWMMKALWFVQAKKNEEELDFHFIKLLGIFIDECFQVEIFQKSPYICVAALPLIALLWNSNVMKVWKKRFWWGCLDVWRSALVAVNAYFAKLVESYNQGMPSSMHFVQRNQSSPKRSNKSLLHWLVNLS